MKLGKMILALFTLIAAMSVTQVAMANTETKYSYYDKATAPMIVVMNYHHIGEEGAYPQIDNIRISPEEFRRQLETLKAEGYTTISQAQLVNYLQGVGQIPQKSLFITIDDGYQSTYTYAYPVLKELGMTALLFPIIADVERGERLGAPMLTWAELRELAQSGVMEIGNHTYDLHWRYENIVGQEALISNYDRDGNRIPAFKRRAIIEEDLLKAEQVLKAQTGVDMTKAISYPFGAYSELTLEVVEKLGYELGFTTEVGYHVLGAAQTNLLEIKRHGINYRNTTEKLLQTFATSTMLAQKRYEARNLRLISHYNARAEQLYMRVSAVGGYASVESVRFEVWQNDNGKRTYVAPASLAEMTLASDTPAITHTESIATPAFQKGVHYSMKVVMTNADGSIDNEWINFTYE